MPTLESNARNAAVDAVAALLNSGTIVFETAGASEVATVTFGATAFGASAAGTATANAIADDTSATGGTIGSNGALLKTSGAALVITASVTTTGGGGDFEISSLVVGVGDTVSITSLTLTQPAS